MGGGGDFKSNQIVADFFFIWTEILVMIFLEKFTVSRNEGRGWCQTSLILEKHKYSSLSLSIRMADSGSRRTDLWKLRRACSWTQLSTAPGRIFRTCLVGFISRLPRPSLSWLVMVIIISITILMLLLLLLMVFDDCGNDDDSSSGLGWKSDDNKKKRLKNDGITSSTAVSASTWCWRIRKAASICCHCHDDWWCCWPSYAWWWWGVNSSKIVKIISKQSFQVIFFRYDKNDDDDVKCKFYPLLKMWKMSQI